MITKGKSNPAMILIIVLIAAIIALAVYLFSDTIIDYFAGISQPKITPPEATGSIDDLQDSLLKEIADEAELLKQEEEDAELVVSDDDEINNFGQSIDENEL